MVDFNEHWYARFIDMASLVASWSKDPRTQVGAVLVSPHKQVLATGFNGVPRGVPDVSAFYTSPDKYMMVEHAEANVVHQCAMTGMSAKGGILFLNWYPTACSSCARALIQSGVKWLIGPNRQFSWGKRMEEDKIKDLDIAKYMLLEAGIETKVIYEHSLSDT